MGGQRFEHYLRPYACGVADRYCEGRLVRVGGHLEVLRAGAKNSAQSSSASTSPKPPDLLATGKPWNMPPSKIPQGNPGSISSRKSIECAPIALQTNVPVSPPVRNSAATRMPLSLSKNWRKENSLTPRAIVMTR